MTLRVFARSGRTMRARLSVNMGAGP